MSIVWDLYIICHYFSSLSQPSPKLNVADFYLILWSFQGTWANHICNKLDQKCIYLHYYNVIHHTWSVLQGRLGSGIYLWLWQQQFTPEYKSKHGFLHQAICAGEKKKEYFWFQLWHIKILEFIIPIFKTRKNFEQSENEQLLMGLPKNWGCRKSEQKSITEC